ncbi:hypothetical protein [Pontibacter sp. H249]|uniref:hypothetical protein n=1 Tax=Pontibacter sp. H249 TaxID=3133420 RepID=UPI0030BE3104
MKDKNYESFRSANHIQSIKMLVSIPNKNKNVDFELKAEAFYTSKGNLIKYRTYNPFYHIYTDRNAIKIDEYNYDGQGKLISIDSKGVSKNITGYYFHQEIIYTYDEFGNRVDLRMYNRQTDLKAIKVEFLKPKITSTVNTLQDESIKPNNVVLPYASSSSTALFNYSEANSSEKLQIIRIFDEVSNKLRLEETIMKNTNNLVEHTILKDMLNNRKTIIAFKYDEQGNETERIDYNGRGRLLYKYVNTFNEKGEISQVEVWERKKKRPIQIIRYQYEYY